MGMLLYACKGAHHRDRPAHPLHRSKRERKRERKKREGERQKESERCGICPELLFLFLKGMTGALAPFSYLVFYSQHKYYPHNEGLYKDTWHRET